jgi:flagellar biosynthesis regulator FlaF
MSDLTYIEKLKRDLAEADERWRSAEDANLRLCENVKAHKAENKRLREALELSLRYHTETFEDKNRIVKVIEAALRGENGEQTAEQSGGNA